MPHEDQFTAVGPSLTGSGHPRSGFSTKASDMVYGVNVVGEHCGVYGATERVTVDTSRDTPVEGIGVFGMGESYGIFGNGNPGIAGVYGQNNRGHKGVIGVTGQDGTGVVGANLRLGVGHPIDTWRGTMPPPSMGGSGTGVWGISGTGDGTRGDSARGNGVHGSSEAPLDLRKAGVLGEGVGSPGVRGISKSTAVFAPPGVQGESDIGSGVFGRSGTWHGVTGISGTGTGVIGITNSEDGVGVVGSGNPGPAGIFNGRVEVRGNLTVVNGDKPFKIDHPLDPENRYLLHNCVESSERKNIYDGVAQLDEDGAAWVDLPEWFEALNGDFRYQLTSVGGAAPDLHVAEEISENLFKIAGGQGGMKVCWQVTGSRKDPWAAANPFEVEQEKPQKDRGRYLQPDLYGAPEEQRIMIFPDEARLQQMMRQEPPQEPPQAPEMPPGFDYGRLEEETRRPIDE